MFESDNTTVVAAIRSGSCREVHVMHLLRILHFIAAHYHFTFTSTHLPGSCNSVADAISRNSLQLSTPSVLRLNPQPSSVHPMAIDLLGDVTIDWTSDSWRARFTSC